GPACRPRDGCWPRSAPRPGPGGTAAASSPPARGGCAHYRLHAPAAHRGNLPPFTRHRTLLLWERFPARCLQWAHPIPPDAGVERHQRQPFLGQAPLAGRDAELATVRALCERAERDEAQLVAIGGEPGVGKSRLLAELGAEAGARGWRVLRGGAYEGQRLSP